MRLKINLYRSVEVCPYRFNFFRDKKRIRKGSVKGTYLKISAMGRDEQWSLTIPGNTHVYGYLTAALEQGRNEQLHGYAFVLNVVSMLLTQDQGFNADIQKAIVEWQKRKEAEGGEKAKAVTDSEEMAAQAFMEDIVSEEGSEISEGSEDADKSAAL